MKILFHIAHPAQYHMFKHLIKKLTLDGHEIKITINSKDILEELMIEDGIPFTNILPKRRRSNNRLNAILTLIKKDIQILKLQWRENYDMMVGTEAALSHISWLFRKPVFIMLEDDVSVIKNAARISFPFAKHIVSPVSCNLGKWSKKKIAYNGYQKTAYLHPKYFTPQREIIGKFISTNTKYFFIRVSGLTAYHDNGVQGFSEDILRRIISKLQPFGNILLSTEKKLPDDLLPFLFKTELSNIHHFLAFAEILIADSQSMCVEAALLGTPSIRFSDFSGRIGVLDELENKYGLTYGIHPSNEEQLFKKIDEFLIFKNLKDEWQKRRSNMLEDKIDVTAFWTWLIEKYPDSISVLKKNQDFQFNFK